MSQKDSGIKNTVLVHGAWEDGSSWSGVIERLQKSGYKVTALKIPLSSFAEDVARVREVLIAQNGPTILVRHSFGGAVITRLGADAPNVAGLVYVATFAPDKGETLKGLVGGGPQPPAAAAIRPDAQGFLCRDADGVMKYLAPDVSETQARLLAAVQKPIRSAVRTQDK